MKKGLINIKIFLKTLLEGVLTRLRGYTKAEGFIILLLLYFFSSYGRLRTHIQSFLSTITVLEGKAIILPLLTTSINILLLVIISTLISYIFGLFKKDDDLAKSKVELLNNIEYYVISLEDIEVWAKNKGLYNKVPEDLWVELRKAKSDSIFKTYNTELTLKSLNVRNIKDNNLIRVQSRILDLLNTYGACLPSGSYNYI